MALFKRFQDVGVTVLVASHDINLINRMDMRIMRLNQGEMEQDGVSHGMATNSKARDGRSSAGARGQVR